MNFKKILNEASEMTPEEYYEDAELGMKFYLPIIKRMFPSDWDVVLQYSRIMGDKSSITARVSSPWKVTRFNAKINFEVMMHLTDNFGKVGNMNKFSFENNLIKKKWKYRKITANSPNMAIKKWFDFLDKHHLEMIKEASI